MSALKVLHVIPSINMSKGGPSSAVLQLCKGLAQQGVEVTLATDAEPGLKVRESIVERDGYSTWYFKRMTDSYDVSLPLSRWLFSNVRSFDLVHLHSVFTYPPIPAAIAAKRSKVPYLLTPHGILMEWGMQNRRTVGKKISIKLIEKRILGGAELLHLTSVAERQELPPSLRNLPSEVIPLGVDLSAYAGPIVPGWLRTTYNIPEDAIVVVTLSRLDPKKGLDLLLSSFGDAIDSGINAFLVMIGDGEPAFTASLKRDIQALGLADRVVLTGFFDDLQKARSLRDSDIFALTSYSESFGIAPIEAMASRLPVIVSDQVGIHPYVSNEKAGIVIPCDRSAVTDALARLALDESLRENMGNAGGKLAEEQFSTEAMVKTMITCYKRITGLKG